MNAITKQTTGKPLAASAELRESLARFGNALEKTPAGNYQLADTWAPGRDDLRALELRRDDLRAGMARAAPRELSAEVAAMFLRFPSSSRDGGNTGGQVAAYVEALKNFPLWAVKQSIARVCLGATFPPSAPVIVKEAEAGVAELVREGTLISNILTADIYHEPTPEEKERVKAGFAQLLKDLAMNTDIRNG